MVISSSEKQNYLTRISNGINTFDTYVWVVEIILLHQ